MWELEATKTGYRSLALVSDGDFVMETSLHHSDGVNLNVTDLSVNSATAAIVVFGPPSFDMIIFNNNVQKNQINTNCTMSNNLNSRNTFYCNCEVALLLFLRI